MARRLGCALLLSVLAGCGSQSGGGSTQLPFTTARTFQVLGVDGGQVALVIVPVADVGRQTGLPTVTLTSRDGTFNNTPVTVLTRSATRITGTARTTTDSTVAVLIEFLDSAATRARLTVTGPGVAFVGTGTGTAGVHELDLTIDNEDEAATSAMALAGGLGGVLSAFAAALSTDPSSLPEGITVVQGCPLVTYQRAGSTVLATVDYGDGCAGEGPRADTISGVVVLTINLTAKSVAAAFDQFAVDGQAVTGTLSATLHSQSWTAPTFDLAIDLTVAERGTIAGTLTGMSVDGGMVSIPAGELDLTPAGGTTTYHAVLTNIVINRPANGNSSPQAGSIALTWTDTNLFGLPVTQTVVVTFDGDTPTSGQVTVQIGSLPPQTVTLPL